MATFLSRQVWLKAYSGTPRLPAQPLCLLTKPRANTAGKLLPCFKEYIYAEKNVHIDEFLAVRDALLSYDDMSHADLSFPVSGLGEQVHGHPTTDPRPESGILQRAPPHRFLVRP